MTKRDDEMMDVRLPRVGPSTRAALVRLAYRISRGFAGEVSLQISKNGGVMTVKWIETETGDMLKELHGGD